MSLRLYLKSLGMTVKAIQQRTGANVSIPNAAEASDPMNR